MAGLDIPPFSNPAFTREASISVYTAFPMLEVHRTHRAKILNHGQVEDSLDRHGWSASKLWNVIRLRLIARET